MRRLALFFALAAVIAGSLAHAAAPPTAAAAPDLTLTADARYDVDPTKGRVHVSVALTAVNHLADTKTHQYYFDRAFLAVQPGTTGFRITSATGGPKVAVAARTKDHTLLRIDFGSHLPAGASRAFALTFDIADPGGAPTRDVRVGSSLVTFPAWGYGSDSTPGGSVTVTFPAGYHVDVKADGLRAPTTDSAGKIVYATGRLAAPLTFFAYFIADRPSAFNETTATVQVGGRPLQVSLHAWPDDAAWGKRIASLMERALPVLGEKIGLVWGGKEPLVVAEAISRSTAGYSGLYDPAQGRIEIAYYAGSYVALHEAAHVWFDGSLLADRWATEGFASWYALETAKAIKEKVVPQVLTAALQKSRIPLNAWGPVGTDSLATDDYGYAAAAELARLVAERAGSVGLTGIWKAVRAGVWAYQPQRAAGAAAPATAPSAEAGAPPPDWRGLLDLLEERTGKTYDDLWRTWVVRPTEAALLDQRTAARKRYGEVSARAGDWRMPVLVRQAMRAWRFDQATQLLDAASRTLDDRDAVLAAARGAGLQAPDALRLAFEGDRGFAAAGAEADAELATIDAYRTATTSRPAQLDPVQQIGLLGATPDADLARAATAFTGGDLRGSYAASVTAQTLWTSSTELGRNRILSIIATILSALFVVGLLVSWARGRSAEKRRRRQRRFAIAQAHRIEQTDEADGATRSG